MPKRLAKPSEPTWGKQMSPQRENKTNAGKVNSPQELQRLTDLLHECEERIGGGSRVCLIDLTFQSGQLTEGTIAHVVTKRAELLNAISRGEIGQHIAFLADPQPERELAKRQHFERYPGDFEHEGLVWMIVGPGYEQPDRAPDGWWRKDKEIESALLAGGYIRTEKAEVATLPGGPRKAPPLEVPAHIAKYAAKFRELDRKREQQIIGLNAREGQPDKAPAEALAPERAKAAPAYTRTRIFAEHWQEVAGRGYSPILLHPAGTKIDGVDRSKTPCLKEWSRHCETPMTPKEIERGLGSFPHADIAVCGGYGGLAGVDIDTLDKDLQTAILEALPAAPTRLGNPGKAGLLLFRWTGEGPAPNWRLLDKSGKVIVELKGHGGQFVVAPSMWPGGHGQPAQPYRMADGGELPPVADLPELTQEHLDKLIEVLKPHLRERRQTGEFEVRPDGPLTDAEKQRYTAYARTGLKNEAEALAKIAEGGRNRALFDAACKLGQFAHHEVLAIEELADTLAEACGEPGNGLAAEDGLPSVRATIESGLFTSRNDPLRLLKDRTAETVAAELNKDHAFINSHHGKAKVLCESFNAKGEPEIYYYLIGDFHTIKANLLPIPIKGGSPNKPKPMAASQAWIHSPNRRSYQSVVFDPSTEERNVKGHYNLWHGFGVKPKKGDWSLMEKHIVSVMAKDNVDSAAYITMWLAWAVQNPNKQAESALVFKGKRGSGKGSLGNTLMKLFGQHAIHLSNTHLLTGRFSRHFESCAFVFADEAIWAGDKAAEQQLKRMITEPTLAIEGKNRDAFMAPNYLKIMMASNEEWVAPVGPDERRFAAFNVSPDRVKDEAYFGALYAQLENGGYEAMLYDLLKMDLEDWHPRQNIPDTEALREQALRSLSPELKWLLTLLEEGKLPSIGGISRDREPSVSNMNVLLEEARKAIGRKKEVGDQDIATFLKDWGAAKKHTNAGNVWKFPALSVMRAEFDRRYGKHEWDEPHEWC